MEHFYRASDVTEKHGDIRLLVDDPVAPTDISWCQWSPSRNKLAFTGSLRDWNLRRKKPHKTLIPFSYRRMCWIYLLSFKAFIHRNNKFRKTLNRNSQCDSQFISYFIQYFKYKDSSLYRTSPQTSNRRPIEIRGTVTSCKAPYVTKVVYIDCIPVNPSILLLGWNFLCISMWHAAVDSPL